MGAAGGPTTCLGPMPTPPIPKICPRHITGKLVLLGSVQFNSSSVCAGISSGPLPLILINTPSVSTCEPLPVLMIHLSCSRAPQRHLPELPCWGWPSTCPCPKAPSWLPPPNQGLFSLSPLLLPSESQVPSLRALSPHHNPSPHVPPCSASPCWFTSQSCPRSPRASQLICPAVASPSPEHPAPSGLGSVCSLSLHLWYPAHRRCQYAWAVRKGTQVGANSPRNLSSLAGASWL